MNRLDFFKKLFKGAAVVVVAPLVPTPPKARQLIPNDLIVSVAPGVQEYIDSVEADHFNPAWQIVLIHRRGDHPDDPKDKGQYCPNSGGWR